MVLANIYKLYKLILDARLDAVCLLLVRKLDADGPIAEITSIWNGPNDELGGFGKVYLPLILLVISTVLLCPVCVSESICISDELYAVPGDLFANVYSETVGVTPFELYSVIIA